MKAEYTCKDGRFDGLSRQWHENGRLKREINWKDDKFVSTRSWDENGQLIRFSNQSTAQEFKSISAK